MLKSLFDTVLDLTGRHSLYALSTVRAEDSAAVVELSDAVIWSSWFCRIRWSSWQGKDSRRLVLVKPLIGHISHLCFVVRIYLETLFRFSINSGRWSDISETSIPETNLFVFVVNMPSINIAVLSVIRDSLVISNNYSLVIIGMRD